MGGGVRERVEFETVNNLRQNNASLSQSVIATQRTIAGMRIAQEEANCVLISFGAGHVTYRVVERI
jgi:hypothetical protein